MAAMAQSKRYEITVMPKASYLADQSDAAKDPYVFSYTINVTNTAQVPVQLIARHWLIDDSAGHRQEVKGLGVVGQQPLLAPGESFRYTSGCRLQSPNGTMQGSYFVVSENAERFDVPIPLFVLEAGGDGLSVARVLH